MKGSTAKSLINASNNFLSRYLSSFDKTIIVCKRDNHRLCIYASYYLSENKIFFSKKKCLLDVYLQPSKYVMHPLYHVENVLIILYIQEFLKDISLLANEVEVDRNQMQI